MTQWVTREIGIITLQKTVSHPFTRRMNTGSPWTLAHKDLMTDTSSSFRLARDTPVPSQGRSMRAEFRRPRGG